MRISNVHRGMGLLCAAAAMGICLPLAASAATLEVTHSPGAEQYDSVNAALAVATDNDVIEIIDNSAAFVEAVVVDGTTLSKNNLTLRGQAGLDPKPVIQGPSSPESTTWDLGMTMVFSYGGANVDNLQVANIRFEANGAGTCVDARFWNGATFDNCELIGGVFNSVRSQVASTLNNCYLEGGYNIVEHFFGGPLALNNCTVRGGSSGAMLLHSGTLNVDSCYIAGEAGCAINCDNNADWGDVYLNLSNSVITDFSSSANNLIPI